MEIKDDREMVGRQLPATGSNHFTLRNCVVNEHCLLSIVTQDGWGLAYQVGCLNCLGT